MQKGCQDKVAGLKQKLCQGSGGKLQRLITQKLCGSYFHLQSANDVVYHSKQSHCPYQSFISTASLARGSLLLPVSSLLCSRISMPNWYTTTFSLTQLEQFFHDQAPTTNPCDGRSAQPSLTRWRLLAIYSTPCTSLLTVSLIVIAAVQLWLNIAIWQHDVDVH
jgi:hypothetical protein